MALVRCTQCGRPRGRTQHYTTYVEPWGYPDTAVICGQKECTRPGVVSLTEEEHAAYREGERIFTIPNAAVKLRVR